MVSNKDLPGAFGTKEYFSNSVEILILKSPIDNSVVGNVCICNENEYNFVVNDAYSAYLSWSQIPAPQRGEIIRKIAIKIRENKNELARMITKEMGKIYTESLGEVQELIDIADYAVGLSRKLYGYTMHSERPNHRMFEQWHPLGVVGVITAFNFPVAVWGWNAMIGAVCGNSMVWKPSPQTAVVSVTLMRLCREVLINENLNPAIFSLVIDAEKELGQKIADDKRIVMVSATGSTNMGKSVGIAVSKRLGKILLELGGNNAVIVLNDANVHLAVDSVFFGAVGTAGQRCTSTRRVLIQESIYERFKSELLEKYSKIKIGDPQLEETVLGPLVNKNSVHTFIKALEEIKIQGGKIIYGGEKIPQMASDCYVKPAIVEVISEMEIVKEETFAPILYLIKIKDLQEAIYINNSVTQGLSSAIFTNNINASETFLSHLGSDCGIANVNLGTSGAEIGGAFGGEKETGGGREAGSDAWKNYMRRQTTTINYGDKAMLAQGVKF